MEELCGEVAVKEIHSITNVLRKSWSRNRCSEWLKIQLKNKVSIQTAPRSHTITQNAKHIIQFSSGFTLTESKLQKVMLPSINKFLFEVQELRRSQLLNYKSMNIHPYVLPHTGPRANSKCNPWRQNNCFLVHNICMSKYICLLSFQT